MGGPPNLVIIILDSVRAKSVQIGGGKRVARTPVIDSLAPKASVFTRAIAPANWTVPAMMSVATGTYPSVHGRRSFVQGKAPFETTASWLVRAGYETAMFTEQMHLVSGYGLEDGYQLQVSPMDGSTKKGEERTTTNELLLHTNFLYTPRTRKLLQALPPLVLPINAVNHQSEAAFKSRVCGPEIVSRFEEWMRSRVSGKPFHLLFNFVDGHEPYPRTHEWNSLGWLDRWYLRTPKFYLLSVPGLQRFVPWREFEGGYLLAVEASDAKTGRVLRALEAAGEIDNSLIVIAADHGQSFGERGHVFHGNGAVDAVTRIPLLVLPPRGVILPKRVDRWASLCEVTGWLKAAAKGLPPFGEEGRAPEPFAPDLLDTGIVYSEGNPAGDQNRSLIGIGMDQSWNHRLVAAYRGEEKFILDLEDGSILHWQLSMDPDIAPPEVLSDPIRDSARESVFGPYLRSARDQKISGEAVEREALSDKRMRSWGYD
jgi:hypothetical protein